MSRNYEAKTYINPGVRYAAEMPHSEVCVHMRIAGKLFYFEWYGGRAVQLFGAASGDCPFSAPILPGEAGIFQDKGGFYYYPPESNPEPTPEPKPAFKQAEKVSMDQIIAACQADDNRGFCLACGAEAFGVEPDARRYTCESCGEPRVYGAEELLIMGVGREGWVQR
jgi:hypothetical protein